MERPRILYQRNRAVTTVCFSQCTIQTEYLFEAERRLYFQKILLLFTFNRHLKNRYYMLVSFHSHGPSLGVLILIIEIWNHTQIE